MEPIDFRNATWDGVKAKLMTAERRWRVYESLRDVGPGTTREVAARLKVEVHAIRPRFTELYQAGFIGLVSEEITKEGGTYFARSREQFKVWIEDRRSEIEDGQPELPLNTEMVKS